MSNKEKRRFRVAGMITISCSKDVLAGDEGEARRIFTDLATPRLCHQCAVAGFGDPDSVELSGELDGTPVATHIEEIKGAR